jgi:hypothetical protein
MPRITDPDLAHAAALTVAAGREALHLIRQDEHDRAVLYARQLRNRAELYRLLDRKPADAILELAGAARIGQTRALTQLEDGRRMVELYPLALELLEAGALLVGTAEMLLAMTRKCSEDVQLELGRRIIGTLAPLDAADARRLIEATIVEVEGDLDLQAQKDRHAQAQANRGVWVKPVEDGMVRIGAEVDAVTGQRFALELEELVRAQKVLDDRTGTTRTAQQRRADVLAELPGRHLQLLQAFQQGRTLAELLPEGIPSPRQSAENTDAQDTTAASSDDVAPDAAAGLSREQVAALLFALPVRNPVTMYVHIPMTTVLDLDNRSGYIEGFGAITAHRARLLRPTASLHRLAVDARTGVPLDIDATAEPPVGEPDWTDPAQVTATAEQIRHRLLRMLRTTAIDHRAEPHRQPSTALKRLVQARDIGCDGPGCPMRASRCELDHEQDWALGGLTAEWNLKARSTRCHHCRHDGWQVRHSADGLSTWTSPLGQKVFRRSPWRIPPPEPTGQLPPPSLDRPDGGKSPSDRYADPALDRPLDSRLSQDPWAPAEPAPDKPSNLPPAPKQLPEDEPLTSAWDPPPF